MSSKQIYQATLLLTLFAVIAGSLVSLSFTSTAARIDANEREALLETLSHLLPPERYDNNLLDDTVEITAKSLLGTEEAVTVYRARKEGKPVAAAFMPIAPDGYSGQIKLLVGVYYDGTLAGVRVISHRETPGLGDGVETRRSDWVLQFNGRSLENPQRDGWRVKRDGGVFEQLTGATITPRAIVKAVHKSLLFHGEFHDRLYAEKAPPAEGSP